jgi:phosphatidylserine/phosphatidylglycerophosphate/cardiolipin synthase-like enzyme
MIVDLARRYRRLLLVILADGVAAIVGSINSASGSLDDRRELAIEVRDDNIVDRLYKTAQYDWVHSHALDLSDEGCWPTSKIALKTAPISWVPADTQ